MNEAINKIDKTDSSHARYEADNEIFSLLGAALYSSQRIEYCLYGIVSHFSHLPEAQKEKRFRNLTPEKFLRSDGEDIKATLGQLIEAFGDKFMIKTQDLVVFYNERNVIAHNYFRIYMCPSDLPDGKEAGKQFIRNFIQKALYWEPVLRGMLYEFMAATAKKHEQRDKIKLNNSQEEDIGKFRQHVALYLKEKSKI